MPLDAFAVLRSRPRNAEPPPILNKSKTRSDTAAEPSRFKIDGVEFIRKKDIAVNKKRRDSNSEVWKHGKALVRLADKKEVFTAMTVSVRSVSKSSLS